ncbi:hypothetical protein ACWD5F_13760 [Streptomyces sp. NPDC002499]
MVVDVAFDSAGLALCCAAAVRLGGAVRVLAARAGLGSRYDVVAAGLEHVVAFLGGMVIAEEWEWLRERRSSRGVPELSDSNC